MGTSKKEVNKKLNTHYVVLVKRRIFNQNGETQQCRTQYPLPQEVLAVFTWSTEGKIGSEPSTTEKGTSISSCEEGGGVVPGSGSKASTDRSLSNPEIFC